MASVIGEVGSVNSSCYLSTHNHHRGIGVVLHSRSLDPFLSSSFLSLGRHFEHVVIILMFCSTLKLRKLHGLVISIRASTS